MGGRAGAQVQPVPGGGGGSDSPRHSWKAEPSSATNEASTRHLLSDRSPQGRSSLGAGAGGGEACTFLRTGLRGAAGSKGWAGCGPQGLSPAWLRLRARELSLRASELRWDVENTLEGGELKPRSTFRCVTVNQRRLPALSLTAGGAGTEPRQQPHCTLSPPQIQGPSPGPAPLAGPYPLPHLTPAFCKPTCSCFQPLFPGSWGHFGHGLLFCLLGPGIHTACGAALSLRNL